MQRIAILLGLLALALPALGDVVHLKTGTSLEGQVVETDEGVIVKLPAGEVRISKDAIERIEPKTSVLEEYQQRAKQVQADDADAHYRLGLWARQQGLKAEAEAHLKTAVAIDPDHAGARRALGYRKVDGQWMTEEEEMRARGLVQFDGEWMPPQAAAKLRELKAELDVAREKRRAAEVELQKSREELDREQQQGEMPVYGPNPYDQYYSTQHLRRGYYHRPYHYYRWYYSAPGYPVPYFYGPYGGWWHYPGGRRQLSPSRWR
ncbi:MAG: hypothetical protein ACOC8A_00325 [bacterium]